MPSRRWDKGFAAPDAESSNAGGCPDLSDETEHAARPYDVARDGPYRGWLV